MEFRKCKKLDDAAGDAVILSLYRCDRGQIRGWFVGPVLATSGMASVPYEPKSRNLLAVLAIMRARDIAVSHGLQVCIVDPDDLWDEAWVSY